MELLCPSCQQKLTIPDQYAGQLMKCPLCQQNFPAPALPTTPAAAAPPPPPPPILMEPLPPPPPPPVPARGDGWQRDRETEEHLPALQPVEEAPQPPGDYTHFWSVYFSPKVLMWVPAPLLFVVFIMTFFPWVGVYPGGVFLHSQNAYMAAFGGYSTDEDLKDGSPFRGKLATEEPGFGIGVFFFLLVFFPTLLLAIAATVLGVLGHQVPPFLRMIRPWRWALVGGLSFVALCFLWLQGLIGFSIENRTLDATNKKANEMLQNLPEQADQAAKMRKGIAVLRGVDAQALVRTFWFHAAEWLLFLTFLVSLMLFWIDFRGNKPLPRVDIIF